MGVYKPNLNDVPETMLWTMHNRTFEALRGDGVLTDENAVRIYQSLGYNYEYFFGLADGSHGLLRLMSKIFPILPILNIIFSVLPVCDLQKSKNYK